jgi:hypothetical protein
MTSSTSLASMILTASFHQKNTELDVSINPGTKMTYPGPSMWDGSSKIHFSIDFGNLPIEDCGGQGCYL